MAAPIGRRVLGTYSICRRCFSCSTVNLKGVVLGVYEPAQKDDVPELTPAAKHYDQTSDGQLTSVLNTVCRGLKGGKSRVLYPRAGAYDLVSVVCLGKRGAGYSTLEEIQEGRENVRKAVAAGVRHLRDVGETEVCVDPCGDPEAAAEGTTLSLFSYDELKNPESRKPLVKASCYTDHSPADSSQIRERWSHGSVLGESQNWSRQLMEMPGNKLTPLIFSQIVTERLYAQGVTVKVRDEEWMESEKMGAFLSVTRGSEEPAVFVELDYSGADSSVQPFALVGKGVTFDSGGISLKPGASMDLMRGDMGGAACVVGAMSALARLKAPLNVRGFIPLCENMPSGKATKPGDVVTARNGKTIQVDNTDAEGRLILADALCYAETFNPYLILDVATLTGAIDVALGSAVTGVYTNSPLLWPYLHQAGQQTGDRVWRMPLLDHYSRQVKDSQLADLNNIGKAGPSGSSCTAAAFLKEFVTNENWFHLDIAGVMTNKDEISYLGKGMSGRPVRTVAEFLQRVGNSLNK